MGKTGDNRTGDPGWVSVILQLLGKGFSLPKSGALES
jgi:hypothetical protein